MTEITKNSMRKVNTFLKQPKVIILKFLQTNTARLITDKTFIKLSYWSRCGKWINLNKPVTFNEKLQWLKLYDRKPEYSTYVDKYEVRKYIGGTIGEQYLIPLIGVYESVSDIPWDALPNRFVLKCTHSSGSNIICNDKSKLNIDESIIKLNKWMKENLYWYGREWPYKKVKPRIICEKFLEDEIFDYKFYCFNSEPKFLYVAQGDNTKGTLRMNFYDLNWKICPFYREDHRELLNEPPKPLKFDEMIQIAKRLCEGKIFIRVDLFYVLNQIYFGELTFSPGSGFTPFSPEEYEKEVGNWIKLPELIN